MPALAEQYLNMGLERDPGNAIALTHLGVSLIRKGQHVEAERVLRRATVASPQHGEGWRNHGSVLHLMARNKEAEVSLREAAKVNPVDEVAYNNLGAALIAMNRPRDAASAFQQAGRALLTPTPTGLYRTVNPRPAINRLFRSTLKRSLPSLIWTTPSGSTAGGGGGK